VTSYAVYYGAGRTSELKRFGLVVVRSESYGHDEVAWLRLHDTLVLAYASIGEDPQWRSGASWYRTDPATGQPLRNETWGTYYVDIRDPAWQEQVLFGEVYDALDKGFDGLFLDTVDPCIDVPYLAEAVPSLIGAIRQTLGRRLLIMNRGFGVLDTVLPVIDGVVFEAFSSRPVGNGYERWEGPDLAWTEVMARQLQVFQRARRLAVFTLDYADMRDARLVQTLAQRARSFGFVPYVSTAKLDQLYLLPQTPGS